MTCYRGAIAKNAAISPLPHHSSMLTLTLTIAWLWYDQEKEYEDKFCNPMYTAQRGFVDDIIDPAETRKLICRHLEVCTSNNLMLDMQPSSTYTHVS